jgi:hypothetical protein
VGLTSFFIKSHYKSQNISRGHFMKYLTVKKLAEEKIYPGKRHQGLHQDRLATLPARLKENPHQHE